MAIPNGNQNESLSNLLSSRTVSGLPSVSHALQTISPQLPASYTYIIQGNEAQPVYVDPNVELEKANEELQREYGRELYRKLIAESPQPVYERRGVQQFHKRKVEQGKYEMPKYVCPLCSTTINDYQEIMYHEMRLCFLVKQSKLETEKNQTLTHDNDLIDPLEIDKDELVAKSSANCSDKNRAVGSIMMDSDYIVDAINPTVDEQLSALDPKTNKGPTKLLQPVASLYKSKKPKKDYVKVFGEFLGYDCIREHMGLRFISRIVKRQVPRKQLISTCKPNIKIAPVRLPRFSSTNFLGKKLIQLSNNRYCEVAAPLRDRSHSEHMCSRKTASTSCVSLTDKRTGITIGSMMDYTRESFDSDKLTPHLFESSLPKSRECRSPPIPVLLKTSAPSAQYNAHRLSDFPLSGSYAVPPKEAQTQTIPSVDSQQTNSPMVFLPDHIAGVIQLNNIARPVDHRAGTRTLSGRITKRKFAFSKDDFVVTAPATPGPVVEKRTGNTPEVVENKSLENQFKSMATKTGFKTTVFVGPCDVPLVRNSPVMAIPPFLVAKPSKHVSESQETGSSAKESVLAHSGASAIGHDKSASNKVAVSQFKDLSRPKKKERRLKKVKKTVVLKLPITNPNIDISANPVHLNFLLPYVEPIKERKPCNVMRDVFRGKFRANSEILLRNLRIFGCPASVKYNCQISDLVRDVTRSTEPMESEKDSLRYIVKRLVYELIDKVQTMVDAHKPDLLPKLTDLMFPCPRCHRKNKMSVGKVDERITSSVLAGRLDFVTKKKVLTNIISSKLDHPPSFASLGFGLARDLNTDDGRYRSVFARDTVIVKDDRKRHRRVKTNIKHYLLNRSTHPQVAPVVNLSQMGFLGIAHEEISQDNQGLQITQSVGPTLKAAVEDRLLTDVTVDLQRLPSDFTDGMTVADEPPEPAAPLEGPPPSPPVKRTKKKKKKKRKKKHKRHKREHPSSSDEVEDIIQRLEKTVGIIMETREEDNKENQPITREVASPTKVTEELPTEGICQETVLYDMFMESLNEDTVKEMLTIDIDPAVKDPADPYGDCNLLKKGIQFTDEDADMFGINKRKRKLSEKMRRSMANGEVGTSCKTSRVDPRDSSLTRGLSYKSELTARGKLSLQKNLQLPVPPLQFLLALHQYAINRGSGKAPGGHRTFAALSNDDEGILRLRDFVASEEGSSSSEEVDVNTKTEKDNETLRIIQAAAGIKRPDGDTVQLATQVTPAESEVPSDLLSLTVGSILESKDNDNSILDDAVASISGSATAPVADVSQNPWDTAGLLGIPGHQRHRGSVDTPFTGREDEFALENLTKSKHQSSVVDDFTLVGSSLKKTIPRSKFFSVAGRSNYSPRTVAYSAKQGYYDDKSSVAALPSSSRSPVASGTPVSASYRTQLASYRESDYASKSPYSLSCGYSATGLPKSAQRRTELLDYTPVLQKPKVKVRHVLHKPNLLSSSNYSRTELDHRNETPLFADRTTVHAPNSHNPLHGSNSHNVNYLDVDSGQRVAIVNDAADEPRLPASKTVPDARVPVSFASVPCVATPSRDPATTAPRNGASTLNSPLYGASNHTTPLHVAANRATPSSPYLVARNAGSVVKGTVVGSGVSQVAARKGQLVPGSVVKGVTTQDAMSRIAAIPGTKQIIERIIGGKKVYVVRVLSTDTITSSTSSLLTTSANSVVNRVVAAGDPGNVTGSKLRLVRNPVVTNPQQTAKPVTILSSAAAKSSPSQRFIISPVPAGGGNKQLLSLGGNSRIIQLPVTAMSRVSQSPGTKMQHIVLSRATNSGRTIIQTVNSPGNCPTVIQVPSSSLQSNLNNRRFLTVNRPESVVRRGPGRPRKEAVVEKFQAVNEEVVVASSMAGLADLTVGNNADVANDYASPVAKTSDINDDLDALLKMIE